MDENKRMRALMEAKQRIRVLIVCSFLLVVVLVVNIFFYHDIYGKNTAETAKTAFVPEIETEQTLAIKKGKTLFKQNCASCHHKNMRTDMTGPALCGVENRWENKQLLYDWIRNSQKVIASGDAYANALYQKWDKSPMLSFQDFKDDEIETILLYVKSRCGK